MNRFRTIATIALMLAGCGLGMSAEQRVDKARSYLAGDNVQAAIIELKNALQDDPVNLEARLLLAEASFRAGDADTAAKEYQRAVDLGAELDPIRIAFAEALVRLGHAERALELADPVGAPAEQRGRIHWIRGLALTRLGQFEQAEQALDEARADPALAFDVDIARARLELGRGNVARSREILDGLGEKGAESSEYWEILAVSQLSEGKPAEAAQSFRSAVDTAKETFGGRRFVLRGSLAEALLAAGELEEARKVAERLYRDARQHPLSNYLMSRLEYQAGNYQQSLAYAQALLSIQPGSPVGNTLAGAATLAMNQPAQAESYLTRAVDMDPTNFTARKLLAQVRLGLGAPQDALAMLRPMAGTDAEAARLAGLASIQAGDPAAAVELFRSQLEEDPDNELLRMQLVVGLMSAGHHDEALAELDQLKDLDTEGQLRAELLGIAVRLQAGEHAVARAAANDAAAQRPGDAQVRNMLGALFLAADRHAEAAEWFGDALKAEPGNELAEFNLGRMAAADGRLEEAEARFNAVLKKQPGNVAAQTALARLAWGAGRREDAIRRLESLRVADRAALPPRLLLARFLQASGETAKALEVAREASSAHPQNAAAAHSLGQMLLDAGQPAEALRAFERANSISPGNAQLLLSRGRAHAATGQLEPARQDMRSALAINPEFTTARLALVDLERRSGRLDAAAEGIARLKTDAEPGDGPVALLEGELLLARRDYEGAIQAFETALAGGIGGRAAVGLFQAQVRAGRPSPTSTLEQHLENAPDDTVVRVLLADHLLVTGDHPGAAKHYELLVQRQPESAMLLNNLAWVYHQGDDPRAVSVAERAHRLQPDSPMIMDTFGWILHAKGESRRALELIREAARKAPQVAEIRYHHAVLLADTGDTKAAIDEARAVLDDETATPYHAGAQALLERLEKGKE